MAADGSVIIEISADDDELIKAFRKVSKSADGLESDIEGIANEFRQAATAAKDLDAVSDSFEHGKKSLSDYRRDVMTLARTYQSEGASMSDAMKRAYSEIDKSQYDMSNKAKKAAKDVSDSWDDAGEKIERVGDSMERAGSGASKLSGGFTVLKGAVAGLVADLAMRAVDAFVSLGREALNAADAMKKFEGTMSFAGFDAATIDATSKAVKDYAAKTVYELETVANTTAQLASNGIKDFVGLTQAAGNLNAVAGGNADTFKSVAMMLTQTAGAGKLTTENWNQLADAIPGASGKLQEAMLKNGAYTGNFRDAMAAGQITAEEFNQAIMDLGMTDVAQQAASSVATIEGAVGNLKATIVDGIAGLLTDGGGGMEAITGFINGITSVLQNAGQYIGPAIEGIKTAISGIGDAFNNAFTSDQQAAILNFLKTLASALVGLPFQLVSAAVQAVSGAFQALIGIAGAVTRFFSDLPGALSSAASWFGNLAGAVSGALSSALDAVNTWGGNVVSTISSAASGAVNAVGSWFSQIPGRISGALSSALSALKSWGSQMASNAKSAMSNVVSNIASTLRTAISQVTNIGRQIVQGLANGIRSGASAVVNAISSTVSSAISAAKSALGIASPSKVFFAFGRFVSIGFANGIEAGVTFVRKSIKTVSDVTKKQINKLNAEIEAIEAAAQKRQEEKELAEYKKNLAEKYDELGKAELKERAKIQEEIDRLEADWAEKQLQAQEKAQKEALQSRINALEDIQDAYQDAMDEVTRSRDSMEKKLSDFELFNNDDGDLYLWDIQKMIDQIQAYGDAMTALKDRGIADSLFQKIVEMDREEAILYAKKLLALGDAQYDAYMNLWEQKEAASEQVAKSLYQSEVDAIEEEYAGKLPDSLGKVADDAMGTFADRMATAGEAAVNTAKNIADRVLAELERVNAAQRLTAAVGMSTSSFSASLGSKAQNDAEARTVARRASATETAMATAFMQTGKATRDVVLQVNGKEFARATLDDYRSVEDQSPRIVSD